MSTSKSELAAAGALTALCAFQTALALGAPWGSAAYGGTREGTLPNRMRATSGVASLLYGTGAVLIVRGGGSPLTRSRAYMALSALMGIGTIANAASRSPVERAIWTPVTAATAVLAWRSRTPSADIVSLDPKLGACPRRIHDQDERLWRVSDQVRMP